MAVTTPPPASGLPCAHPPPPRELPAAGQTESGRSRGAEKFPPPPCGLPEVSRAACAATERPTPGRIYAEPPPPQGLPEARPKAAAVTAPDPTRDTKQKSGSGRLAPSSKPKRKAKAAVSLDAAPPPPPPPLAHGELPGAAPRIGSSEAEVNRRRRMQADPDPAPLAHILGQEAESWRDLLQDSSDEEENPQDDSGEDSDDGPVPASAADRRQSDLDVLRKHQKGMARAGSRRFMAASSEGASLVESHSTAKMGATAMEDNSAGNEMMTVSTSASSSSVLPGGKRSSLLGRLSSKVRLGGSSAPPTSASGLNSKSGQTLQKLLDEDATRYDKEWYERWESRLSLEGLACTKVATNGKPYDRRLYVDTRNFTLEVRGGKAGSTGILLDDLMDMRQGLSSLEFEHFGSRFKKLDTKSLEPRALVVQTGSRTFSFLFAAEAQREIFLHFILHLLRARGRGAGGGQQQQAAAEGEGKQEEKQADVPAAIPPLNQSGTPQKENLEANDQSSSRALEGRAVLQEPEELPSSEGVIVYPNKSIYEGDLVDGKRHGSGVLKLADGTRYHSQWRNDERHGKGSERWSDGTLFAGSYLKGMRHGYGVMTWPEGSRYTGEFERGRANGTGELVRTDGSIYRGRFAEDCMSGEGQMLWQDGVQYVGQFVENRRDGWGKMMWTSGRWSSYEGNWKDGVQHGHGTLTEVNGTQFSGQFACGKLESWDGDDEESEQQVPAQ
mmetsp:Transcript_11023/g.25205  ORF Transcript_11023/g.25205 Transcript_11023/m.25205 type:complete len:726 (+) Transcript_11023:135-2312(+)